MSTSLIINLIIGDDVLSYTFTIALTDYSRQAVYFL